MSRPPELSALDLGGTVVDSVLRTSAKSVLATGHHGNQRVIIKTARGTADFWTAKLAHEARLYQAFSESPPPVRVPRPVHTDAHRVLVIEHVLGAVVDTERYPEQPLDEATVDSVLSAVTGFAHWTPPPGVLQPMFDLPGRVERYHHQGWFAAADRDALHGLLRQLPAPATPAHGDPLPTNLLLDETGIVLLDFEFTGLFLPGFDLAMLHTLLAATPGAQQRIEQLVAEQGIRTAFAVNKAMVLARELRLHTELPPGELREKRLEILRPEWERARQRLHARLPRT
ncbi:hypothetical protein GCM10009854_34350 [Saccharopolyspora halophila]|uniref:Aminoglycoside phosphotransferase domain-containing protein n=1 Tax=Saccharopolyspora halophila TaxID=405551 RepID=A0ABN3GLK8_9PSEU